MVSLSPLSPLAVRESKVNRRIALAVQVVILVSAGFLVFSPALHGTWLWDDDTLIKNNPLMIDAGGWWKLWLAPPGPDYFPLTSTVEWVLWRLFGDNTLPFHLTSLALHLLSAFLLWRLFTRLGLQLAWLGALLFIVHPLAVESVAWIAELKNTVSLPLLLLSMLGWLRYDEHSRPTDYALAMIFFLAALLAKTSVVMLPFVLLLYTWWKHDRVASKQILALAPFFFIALVLGVVTVCFQKEWGFSDEKIATGGFPVQVAGAGWAILFYLGKCLWPIGLLPIYEPWTFADLTFAQFLPCPILLALFAWIWSQRKTWGRPVIFGLGFFLLNLMPVLGFLPMSYHHISWVANHFAYVPMIGLIGLAIGGAEQAWVAGPQAAGGRPVCVALALLVGVFAWQSRTNAENFRSELAMWSFTLRGYPASDPAHYALAVALQATGRIQESIQEFTTSLQIQPNNATAENNLGAEFDLLGESDQAITHYKRSLKIYPSAEAHFGLGVVFFKRQQFDDAARQYEASLQLEHNSPEAELNLGNAYVSAGRLQPALQAYRAAIRLKADYAIAYFNLGSVLVKLGRTDEAIQAYETTLSFNPQDGHAQAAIDALRQARAVPVITPSPAP